MFLDSVVPDCRHLRNEVHVCDIRRFDWRSDIRQRGRRSFVQRHPHRQFETCELIDLGLRKQGQSWRELVLNFQRRNTDQLRQFGAERLGEVENLFGAGVAILLQH